MARDNLPVLVLALGAGAALWYWSRTRSGGVATSSGDGGTNLFANLNPSDYAPSPAPSGGSGNPDYFSTSRSNAEVPTQTGTEDIDTALKSLYASMPVVLDPSQPKGIRLNNPGNIEKGKSAWLGLAADQSADARYATFTSPVYGIRAMASLIYKTYAGRGLRTPRQIIGTWAPAKDRNDTAAYIADVVSRTGIGADTPVPIGNVPFIAAMIQHENGRQPYASSLIAQGISMA